MHQGFQKFLQAWYKTPRGRLLFQQESQLLQAAISNLFGYYLVQLGCTATHEWLHGSRVSNKLVFDDQFEESVVLSWQKEFIEKQQTSVPIHWVKTGLDFLPLAKETVDVMLLPHTLETVHDPYYLLRQVDTVLVAEGRLVLTGFNPLACGIIKSRLGREGRTFKQANLVRSSRVVEWLEVLGYEIEEIQYSTISCFAGTTFGDSLAGWRLLERIEKLLSRLGLQFGNVYCIVARKKVDAPKLIGASWKQARWLGLAKGRSVATNRLSNKVGSGASQNKTEESATCK